MTEKWPRHPFSGTVTSRRKVSCARSSASDWFRASRRAYAPTASAQRGGPPSLGIHSAEPTCSLVASQAQPTPRAESTTMAEPNELAQRLQRVLGDAFRVERELGGGGMSRVFLVEDIQLDRRIVVKVLPPELGASLSVERFRREIQLAAKLQHPHVVPLLTAGANEGLLYFAMPYIEGESLRARLAREHELPIQDSVRILRDVTDALAYAHAHGVVHRDIKPDNVLVSGRHALVTDFGVAKALSEATGRQQ